MPRTLGEPEPPLDILETYQQAMGQPVSDGPFHYRIWGHTRRGSFTRPPFGRKVVDNVTELINAQNRDQTAHGRPVTIRHRGAAHNPGVKIPHITIADLNAIVFGEETLGQRRERLRDEARRARREAQDAARLQKLLDWLFNGPVPKDPKAAREPRPPPRQRRPPKGRKLPGTKIRDSALIAAHWLAMHFPRDTIEQGYLGFINNRVEEILRGIFPERYWEPAIYTGRLAEVTFPGWISGDPQPPPPNYQPFNRRTYATYGNPGTPYEVPPPGTGGSQPSPGYLGTTESPWFKDDYLAVLLLNYQLPRVYRWEDRVPIFAKVDATWRVRTDNSPTKIQFSTLQRPVLYAPDDPRINDHWPVQATTGQAEFNMARKARFYRHKKTLPPSGSGEYDATENRRYLLDCNVRAAFYSADTNKVDKLRLKMSPAAALGRYYADSTYVQVDYDATADVYMARHRDPDWTFIPPLRHFDNPSNPHLVFPELGAQQYKQWYCHNFHMREGPQSWTLILKSMRMKGRTHGRIVRALPVATSDSPLAYPDPFFVGDQADMSNPTLQQMEYDEKPDSRDLYQACLYYPGGGQLPQTFPGDMSDAEWRDRYIPMPDDDAEFGQG